MPLNSGTRLGAYEVVALLGAGGMGEVYRARDTRLDRTVAIKVLPSDVASTRELRERFEREARTVAALNHPHICTLHDVGRHEDVDFLVMEYLDGETLQERLLRGALPLEQALQIAVQVADALAAAHRAGVVHRDLKPGNIFLVGKPADGRRGGPSGPPVAKLLDFGLAKPAGPVAAGPASMLPTTPRALTVQGTILGTFQYMAPEQLEGRDADARTDIFAFGSVVYEMVTGRKAFEGKSQVGLIGAILEREPVPISTIQPSVPRQLDHVMRRCLAKNPDERWQTAADLHRELNWVAESSTQEPARVDVPPPVRVRLWRRPVPLAAAVGATFAVALLMGMAAWMSPRIAPAADSRVARLRIVLAPGEELADPQGSAVAISPDGTRVAYVARSESREQLFVQDIADNDARALAGTESAMSPFFSPDGQWIGFFAQGMLKRVSVAAGTVQTVSDAPFGVGGSWGEDGNIYFAASNIAGVSRVSADGGMPADVTQLDRAAGEVSHRRPHLLPGGRALLFEVWTGPARDETRIEIQRLDTGERTVIVRGGATGRYVLTGHVVYARGEELFAVPFDAEGLEVVGQPVRLDDTPRRSTESSQFAVSESGVLVYVQGGPQRDERRLVWVDRDGRVEPLAAPPRAFTNAALSPDGSRAAVNIDAGTVEIWMYDFARGTLTRLTTGNGSSQAPRWTPDGSRIFFRATRNGFRNVWAKTVEGGTPEERFTTGEGVHTPSSWSPDGQWLLYVDNNPIVGGDIWALSMSGDRKPHVIVRTPGNEWSPRLSPDGRWLAYASSESGRYEVFVQPFPGPGSRVQISTEGGTEPVWSRDSRQLFYLNGDRMMAVDIRFTPAFAVANPRVLFSGRFTPSPNAVAGYDVAADGRFLMVQPLHPDPPTNQIHVVLNWFEELTRTASN